MADPEMSTSAKRLLGVAGVEPASSDLESPDAKAAREARARQEIIGGEVQGHHVDIFPGVEVSPEVKTRLLAKFGFDPSMEFLLQGIYDFLEAHTLEDYFDGNEADRKPWEEALVAQYGELGQKILEDNKLRPNRFNDTISSMHMIADIVSVYAPATAEPLRAALALIDQRAGESLDREYLSPTGEYVTRPYPTYKSLSRPQKQEVIDSITFASQKVLQILLEAEVTATDADQVTW